ncbi:DUF4874 domain-containing protein [Streptomyces sp. NPDC056817]|uniref:DUF4874 domain-containing protein n=1 Tax=Streptomyces sp. NPDC056817 TaxID=3345950 RepID=UPI0036A31BF1
MLITDWNLPIARINEQPYGRGHDSFTEALSPDPPRRRRHRGRRDGDWSLERYRGLCVDDPGGRNALPSPHRGFRYEMSYDAIDLTSPWTNEQNHSPDVGETLRTLRSEYGDGASVTQLYFYLWDYATTTIPDSALANIERVLAGLRQARTTAVLRFAYDDAVRPNRRYTVQNIQTHLRQLAPLIGRYSDVVTVWQAGFLGAWGEWHGSYYDHEDYPDAVTEIMRSLVAALPPMVHTQTRYFEKRAMVHDDGALDRIGYHNDYITLGEGLWDYYVPGNPGWPSYLDVSQRHAMDGEMPWDKGQSTDPYAWSKVIDPIAAARRLQTLRFDTLSMVHNATVTIPGWRNIALTEQQVVAAGLPVATGYFRRHDGGEVSRTAFEYIRDHLGYRIEARQARWRQTSRAVEVELDLANTGFAAPKRPRPVQFVLLDPTGGSSAPPTAARTGGPGCRPNGPRSTARTGPCPCRGCARRCPRPRVRADTGSACSSPTPAGTAGTAWRWPMHGCLGSTE